MSDGKEQLLSLAAGYTDPVDLLCYAAAVTNMTSYWNALSSMQKFDWSFP